MLTRDDLTDGLHTGECELTDGKVAGPATKVCLAIAQVAGPDQILVSSTVKDLVAGSGVNFTESGTHTFAGLLGEWRLFAVQQ